MRRVKILPRLASVAAFLCLMFAHLLWPAMIVVRSSNAIPANYTRAGISSERRRVDRFRRPGRTAVMALRLARDALSRIFYQRCFYLFVMLLALIAVAPFMPPTMERPARRELVNALRRRRDGRGGRPLAAVVRHRAAARRCRRSAFQWIGLAQDDQIWTRPVVDVRRGALLRHDRLPAALRVPAGGDDRRQAVRRRGGLPHARRALGLRLRDRRLLLCRTRSWSSASRARSTSTTRSTSA